MTRTLTRTLGRLVLLTCLMAGMLLPRTGAVLAEVAGFDRVVICQGDRLVTLTLGTDGTPIETAIADHGPCALTLGVGLSDPAPGQYWATPYAMDLRVTGPTAPTDRPLWHGPPPERAPPVRT